MGHTCASKGCKFGRVPSGTSRNCLSEAKVWLVVLLTTAVCVVPSLTLRFLRVHLSPTTTDKVVVTLTLIVSPLFCPNGL